MRPKRAGELVAERQSEAQRVKLAVKRAALSALGAESHAASTGRQPDDRRAARRAVTQSRTGRNPAVPLEGVRIRANGLASWRKRRERDDAMNPRQRSMVGSPG